jgi:RsiW-degrading membrane proteinase PrsW (M82 family)
MEQYNGNTEFVKKCAYSKLKLIDCFSDIFKPHSSADLEKFFMSGMRSTTPAPSQMLSEWKKPWIFVRLFFLTLVISLIGLQTGYIYSIPIIQAIITAFVPITCMMFIWEMNIPRNVPAYQILFLFFVGGIFSIILVFVNDNIIEMRLWFKRGTFWQCVMNSIAEEIAKLLIVVVFFIWRERKGIVDRHILTGMLIGCIVGTGFSAFETGQYFQNNGEAVLKLRLLTAPGGHVVWAALYGAGLLLVKGKEKLKLEHFFKQKFLLWFFIPVIFHTFWNYSAYNIESKTQKYLIYATLIIIAWWLIMTLVNQGVKQIVAENNLYSGNSDYSQSTANSQHKSRAFGIKGTGGDYFGKTINFSSPIKIGRDPHRCNLVFKVTTPGVSGLHCELTIKGNFLGISDLGSSNGTFLNGTRLQPNMLYNLKSGDKFWLGSMQNSFEVS